MILNIDDYHRLSFQRSKIFEECRSFNYNFFVVGSKEYYDESYYNGQPSKTIIRQNVFKPNFDDDKVPSLDLAIIGNNYYDSNTQPYLEFNKSIINQYLFLRSVLGDANIRLVLLTSLTKKLHISSEMYCPLIAYGCNVVFDDNNYSNFKNQDNMYGVHFEVQNSEGKFVFCGSNSIVYGDDEEPIANNFYNSTNAIVSVSNSLDMPIKASVIYSNYIDEFCADNPNKQKIVDAISAIVYLCSEKNFLSKEENIYISKYIGKINALCNEEGILLKDLKGVILDVMYSLRITKKSALKKVLEALSKENDHDYSEVNNSHVIDFNENISVRK